MPRSETIRSARRLKTRQAERLRDELVRTHARCGVVGMRCDHYFVGLRSRGEFLNSGADFFGRAYDSDLLEERHNLFFLGGIGVRQGLLGAWQAARVPGSKPGE